MTERRPLSERQVACLRAVAQLQGAGGDWVDAGMVAHRAGLTESVRRHGSEAQGPQSWSGYMQPAFFVGRTLRSLTDRGLLRVSYGDRSKGYYRMTRQGTDALEAADAAA